MNRSKSNKREPKQQDPAPVPGAKVRMYNNRTLLPYRLHQQFGIDKISLYTEDFQVTNIQPLGIIPNRKEQGELYPDNRPLFVTRGGQVVEGERAYFNGNHVNLSLNPKGAFVQYNPSHLLDDLTCDPADIQAVTKLAQDELTENGFNCNLWEAKLSRLDLAKDREMSDKVFAYSGLWGLLAGTRMNQKAEYPDGFRIGNKSRQGVFYDRGLRKNPEGGSTNLMRFEAREMNGKAITRHTDLVYMNDLVKADPKELHRAYVNFLDRDVLRYRQRDGQIDLDWESEVTQLKAFRAMHPKGGFFKWLMHEGFITKIQKVGGMDRMREAITEAGYTRKHAWSMVRELEYMISQKIMLPNQEDQVKKYEEVRLKFCA